MRRNHQTLMVALVVLAIFVLSAIMVQAAATKGKAAPDFKLKGLDGKTYQLSSFRGKKAVVIDFWAVWCPPCQRSLPALQKVWTQYQKKPVQFLGINVDGEGDVAGTVRQKGLTYPNLIGTEAVSREYGVRYIPTLVVIDKKGVVQEVFVGGSPDLEKKLIAVLDKLAR